MRRCLLLTLFSFFCFTSRYGQNAVKFIVGFNMIWECVKNKDYIFDNNFYKCEIYYNLKDNRNYQIMLWEVFIDDYRYRNRTIV
jgi:hypothetical protein